MSLPSVYCTCLSTNSLQSWCNLFKKIFAVSFRPIPWLFLRSVFKTSLPSTLVIFLKSLYDLFYGIFVSCVFSLRYIFFSFYILFILTIHLILFLFYFFHSFYIVYCLFPISVFINLFALLVISLQYILWFLYIIFTISLRCFFFFLNLITISLHSLQRPLYDFFAITYKSF